MSPDTHNQLSDRLLELRLVLAENTPLQQKIAMCMNGWVLMIDDRNTPRRVRCYPPETPASVIRDPWGINS